MFKQFVLTASLVLSASASFASDVPAGISALLVSSAFGSDSKGSEVAFSAGDRVTILGCDGGFCEIAFVRSGFGTGSGASRALVSQELLSIVPKQSVSLSAGGVGNLQSGLY